MTKAEAEASLLPQKSSFETPISIAYYSAANCVSLLDPIKNSLNWPSLGVDDPAEDIPRLAWFARQNPLAPPEALFRWARGQEIHLVDPDGAEAFEDYFLAYVVFFQVLLTVDAEFRLHRARVARRDQAEAGRGPIAPAAYAEDPEDTIMAQYSDPLATNPNYGHALIDPHPTDAAPAEIPLSSEK